MGIRCFLLEGFLLHTAVTDYLDKLWLNRREFVPLTHMGECANNSSLHNETTANEKDIINYVFCHPLGGKHITLISFKQRSIIIWWDQSPLLISSSNYNVLVLQVIVEKLVNLSKESIIQPIVKFHELLPYWCGYMVSDLFTSFTILSNKKRILLKYTHHLKYH